MRSPREQASLHRPSLFVPKHYTEMTVPDRNTHRNTQEHTFLAENCQLRRGFDAQESNDQGGSSSGTGRWCRSRKCCVGDLTTAHVRAQEVQPEGCPSIAFAQLARRMVCLYRDASSVLGIKGVVDGCVDS